MSPAQQVSALKQFLIDNTDIYNITFKRVAEAKFQETIKHTQEKRSLDDYIFMNHKQIADETLKILDKTCHKIISKSDYSYLFTQIGLFSLFLVPPLYPITRYLIILWKDSQFNIFEFSACLVAILLLFTLLCASAFSAFKTTFIKNTEK